MKTYNKELQQRLEQHLTSNGITQNAAAKQIGVSPTALSQYRNSNYPGSVTEVERKIEEYLRTQTSVETHEANTVGRKTEAYVATSISEDVYRAIQYCQLERGMMILHGDAGIGKTKGAMKFIQENPTNAIYIKCSPTSGSLNNTMKLLAKALKLPETRNKMDMILSIADRLRGTDKVIILDEAQHLKLNTLEELRNLSDPDSVTGERGTGIVLIGNTEIYNRMLGKQQAQFAQLFSRVKLCRRYNTSMVTKKDMAAMFPELDDEGHTVELNFLKNISQSKWGIRGAVSVYNNSANNEDTSFEGLKAMAMSMGIGTL